jgi:hypothetical protein
MRPRPAVSHRCSMTARIRVALLLSVASWTIGGALAVRNAWNPFDPRQARTIRHGDELLASDWMDHVRPVRLTAGERALLPPGYPVGAAERAFGVLLAQHERDVRAAARHDPTSGESLTATMTGSVRVESFPGFDLVHLWPRVFARLQAEGRVSSHATAGTRSERTPRAVERRRTRVGRGGG